MRSSTSCTAGPLPIGRIASFRGRDGAFTVRVASGEAGRWKGIRHVLLSASGGPDGAVGEAIPVEACRAYSDRLVLKIRGVDDPSAAEALRGRWVLAPTDEVPPLPDGVYYVERLQGLAVVSERGEPLGRAIDVQDAGGVGLLVIEAEDGSEILLPLVRKFVLEVREDEGEVVVRLPDELRELNEPGRK